MTTEGHIDDFEAVMERLEGRKSEATYREYKRHLRYSQDFLKNTSYTSDNLLTASSADIEDILMNMVQQDYSNSSIFVRQSALQEFFSEAERLAGDRLKLDGFDNPMSELPPITKVHDEIEHPGYESESDIEYLTPAQIDELAKNVPRPIVRNEAMVRLASNTGLRRGELVRLKLSDGTWTHPNDPDRFLDGPPREITVREEIAKNGEQRTIFYPESLDKYLRRWIEIHRPAVYMAPESDYLFPSNRSKHLTGQAFNDVVIEAAENAGLQAPSYTTRDGLERNRVTAHTLRHSFATHCANELDWDIYTLSRTLGHSSVEVTEDIYVHETKERIRKAFETSPPDF